MAEEFGSSEAGKKGGKARAEKLTKQQRREIAQKAAAARWSDSGSNDDIPIVTHGSADHPLKIGDIEIPCYVLSDGRRVLVQGGMLSGLDMKQGTAGRGGGDRLAKFIATKGMNRFVGKDLADVIIHPIRFQVASGAIAYGYEATILADICDAVLQARKEGTLNYQADHIAERCEILLRGFARLGIIALVDEATGYERSRASGELAKILEAFVAKELQKWLPTFDLEFYELMCEVRGEPLSRVKSRPPYFGKLTNNLVYERLAPGVLPKLQELNPVLENGRRKNKHFQHLTPDMGHPKLKEHLAGITTALKMAKIMKLNWKQFLKMLDQTHPTWREMPLLKGIQDDQGEVIET